jgi:hypothetical protein
MAFGSSWKINEILNNKSSFDKTIPCKVGFLPSRALLVIEGATSKKRSWFLPKGGDQHRKATGHKTTQHVAQTKAPSPQHRADAGKPALRRSNTVGPTLQGAGGERKKAMSHARWRARLRRAAWQSERAQAWPLYSQSHCTTPEAETTVTGGETRDLGALKVRIQDDRSGKR